MMETVGYVPFVPGTLGTVPVVPEPSTLFRERWEPSPLLSQVFLMEEDVVD